MSDCATRLAQAQAALHALLTGDSVASVTTGDGKSVSYTPANIQKLRGYIQQLEAECGVNATQNRRGCIRFRG